MTAEVAVMNAHGVALAADSAVTGSNNKIYNTANKVFMLSRSEPVGLMIYQQAQFLGVPWETLIKLYRSQIKDKSFASLSEYGEDFIRFVATAADGSIATTIIQDQLASHLYQRCLGILDFLNKKYLHEYLVERDGLSVIRSRLRKWVNDQLQQALNEAPVWTPGFSVKRHLSAYREQIVKALGEVCKQHSLPISQATVVCIWRFAARSFETSWWNDQSSGIVLAGFGKADLKPQLLSYEIETLVGPVGKRGELSLKYELKNHFTDGTPAIIPFAQRRMVDRLLSGLDPVLKLEISNYWTSVLTGFATSVFKDANIQDKITRKQIRTRVNDLVKLFGDDIQAMAREKCVQPILDNLGILPKEEMADLAEALVSVTSLQKRMTADEESVGGPIDVAVITKGDGFIWLKRKHYFKAEQNPNYFRS